MNNQLTRQPNRFRTHRLNARLENKQTTRYGDESCVRVDGQRGAREGTSGRRKKDAGQRTATDGGHYVRHLVMQRTRLAEVREQEGVCAIVRASRLCVLGVLCLF